MTLIDLLSRVSIVLGLLIALVSESTSQTFGIVATKKLKAAGQTIEETLDDGIWMKYSLDGRSVNIGVRQASEGSYGKSSAIEFYVPGFSYEDLTREEIGHAVLAMMQMNPFYRYGAWGMHTEYKMFVLIHNMTGAQFSSLTSTQLMKIINSMVRSGATIGPDIAENISKGDGLGIAGGDTGDALGALRAKDQNASLSLKSKLFDAIYSHGK